SAIVNSLQEKISTLVDIFSNEISDLRSLIQDRSDVVEDQYQQANDNFDIESIDSAVISASSDSEPELN
ncbi:MAG TPA: hypothetical protein PKN63_07035, partial [Chitinophagales bacterium]|nr:hypothetical protein [Chitinophagales bacterium]